MKIATPKSKVENITPDKAKQMLKQMVNNRKLSAAHVNLLTHIINSGQWGITGQPIIVSSSGKVIDGQHRLHAIVKSGKTVPCFVVTGVDESMYTKLDKGKTRNFADCIPTVANASSVAAATHLVWAEENSYTEDLPSAKVGRGTNDEYKEVFERHPQIVESASYLSGRKVARKLIGGGGGSYCLYRMSSTNKELAEDMITRLNTGVGLAARSPILSLREFFISADNGEALGSLHRLMLVACAWRMVLEGKSGSVNIEKAKSMWNWWGNKL